MRTNHSSGILGAPSPNISPLPMEDSHVTPTEVPSTPHAVPLIASSPQSLEVMPNGQESVPSINVDQDDDHGRRRGRRCGKRHGRWEHGWVRVHVSLAEAMVGHHGRPIRKRKAPSCCTQ